MTTANNAAVLIVGGTHGIGLGIALECLAQMYSLVVVASRKQASVDAAVARLASAAGSPSRVVGFVCNVSTAGDIARLHANVKQLLNARGMSSLHALVSNVGVDPVSGPALKLSEEVYDKIFNSNVKAAWLLVKTFRDVLARGSSVVFMASTGGFEPAFPSGLYGASKTALIGLGKALASELGEDGIRVNTVAPGLVKTRMSEAFWKGPYGAVAEKLLFLRRLGEPEDVAKVVCFAISDAARWMTGETLVVSGGTHTRL